MSRPDVLILGGGIIGLACARELAGRGLQVEVLERGRAGGSASWAAAGLLAPLAETPSGGPFFEACRAARDLWRSWVPELEDESGVALDYDCSGALILFPPGMAEAAALRQLEIARGLGEPAERIENARLRQLLPDLAPRAWTAVLLSGEHRVDNRQVTTALAVAANRRGVVIREGCEVRRVRVGEIIEVEGEGFRLEAPRLVVAAGAWSGSIEGLPQLPVRPVRGQMLRVAEVDWPFLGSVRAEHLYAVRRAGGSLLIGATVEEAEWADHPTPAGLAQLLEFSQRWLPGLAEKPVVETWAGLRPATPDGLPLLGPLDSERLWVATGHYRNGILLAPWTAVEIARSLTASAPAVGEALLPFSAQRFTTAEAAAGASLSAPP